jgi:hypothetical protein
MGHGIAIHPREQSSRHLACEACQEGCVQHGAACLDRQLPPDVPAARATRRMLWLTCRIMGACCAAGRRFSGFGMPFR